MIETKEKERALQVPLRVTNTWLQWGKQQIECLPGNYRRYRSMNKYIEEKEGKGTLYKQKDKGREADKIG